MEAPEKIYLHPDIGGKEFIRPWLHRAANSESVEYIRKDVFVEQACEWIKTNMDDYIYVEYDTVTGMPTNEAHIASKRVVEDFKNYMKGE